MTFACRPVLCVSLLIAGGLVPAAGQADDARQLQGSWRPVSAAVGDKPLPPETLAHISLTIESGRYVATVGESVDKGTFRVDPGQSPKTMDLIATDGPTSGMKTLAIYELKDDTLTICYSLEEGVRPAELKTGGSMQRVLVTYRREREI